MKWNKATEDFGYADVAYASKGAKIAYFRLCESCPSREDSEEVHMALCEY